LDVNSAEWWNSMASRYEARGDLRERPDEYTTAASLIGDGPVLEVGCAFGQFSKYLKDRITYVGMDISSELIVRARKWHPQYVFVCANAARLGEHQWGKAFEHTCSFQMLEHFTWEAFDALMKNLKKVTRTSLIFSVPRGLPSAADAKADGHLIGWEDEADLATCFRRYGTSISFVPCDDNHIMGQLFYE